LDSLIPKTTDETEEAFLDIFSGKWIESSSQFAAGPSNVPRSTGSRKSLKETTRSPDDAVMAHGRVGKLVAEFEMGNATAAANVALRREAARKQQQDLIQRLSRPKAPRPNAQRPPVPRFKPIVKIGDCVSCMETVLRSRLSTLPCKHEYCRQCLSGKFRSF
jgi:hypothetical protein